jgi:hypothetical protein
MLFRRKAPPPPVPWRTVPEAPGFFSSGIRDIDTLFGGGLRVGSVVAVEGDPSVYADDSLLLGLPAILNFLTLGRGALVVPPAGVTARRFVERVLRHIPTELVESRLRVIDYSTVETAGAWHVPMARFGSRAEAMRAMIRAEKAVRGPAQGPYVEVDAADTLENLMGAETALRMMAHGLPRIKEVGNLGLVWVRSQSGTSTAVAGMGDRYLVLARQQGVLMLKGIRPSFSPRRLEWRESGGGVRVELGLP